jgi:multidrug resistance efflux pump
MQPINYTTMRITSKFKTVGLAFAMGAFMFACSQEAQNETNEEMNEAQTEMNQEVNEAQAEMDGASGDANRTVEGFTTWVETNSERAETATKEEWEEIKADYKRREAELEAESSTWDEAARQEWEELKMRWNETEQRTEQRLSNSD